MCDVFTAVDNILFEREREREGDVHERMKLAAINTRCEFAFVVDMCVLCVGYLRFIVDWKGT